MQRHQNGYYCGVGQLQRSPQGMGIIAPYQRIGLCEPYDVLYSLVNALAPLPLEAVCGFHCGKGMKVLRRPLAAAANPI